jgi:acyl carrier protein
MSSSGTTGRPKLIVRSHRSFFHRLGWTWRTLPFGEGEVGCQKAHQTTTHAIYELFEPLLRGVPCVLLSDEVVRDLERFWSEVRAAGVTRLLLVPSMLRATLEGEVELPAGLRAVILMGEAVSSELARSALDAFPSATALFSIYGSTEASSVLLSDLRTAILDGPGLPLGPPLTPEIRARVLGPDERPVGVGEAGRLHIGGPALFDGYLGDPELTARVVREVDGERLFDTRDDVRVQEDGTLEFLGRADHTVKIRGFRVDLLEVERHLRGLPGVTEAVAVAREATGGESVLHAYVTPAGADPSEVLGRLRRILPDHAVPSLLRAMDAFPRTPSGKVDRRRLAEAGMSGAPRWSDAGRSPQEVTIAGIWARLLGHDAFSPDASFFEAGGTSLSMMTLLHDLRVAFDLKPSELDLTHVLAEPTVAGLARRVVRGGDDDPPAPGLVALRTGVDPGAPPLFVLHPAGGTLGSYTRLIRALRPGRAVVGLEDPYLWGERDPTEPFDRWMDRMVSRIRQRQPRGPYQVCAYSSGGALGWEVVRRLEADGDRVAAFVLIDPMGIDSGTRRRYGWWAARCSYEHPVVRQAGRIIGRARVPFTRLTARLHGDESTSEEALPEASELAALLEGAVKDGGLLRRLAFLMELETGVRVPEFDTTAERDGPGVFDRFVEAVEAVHPRLERSRLERIVRQYRVQVRHQQAYRLRPLEADVLLFEPETAYAGLLETLVRPYVRRLRAFRIPVGEPSSRQEEILQTFQGWRTHFWCMRDDTFSAGVAEAVDRLLPVPAKPPGAPEPVGR